MTCERCEQRGKTWDGDDPKCAFKPYYFSTNNWNCATMNSLRELIYEQSEKGMAWFYRDDLATGSIGVLPFESEGYVGNLILTWYKERGKTGQAIIMCDNEKPIELTEDIANEMLNKYGK